MEITCRCPDCGRETKAHRPDRVPVIFSAPVLCECGTKAMHSHALDGKPDVPEQWHRVIGRYGPPTPPDSPKEIARLEAEAEEERQLKREAAKLIPDRLAAVGPRGEFHEERVVTDGFTRHLEAELSGFTVGAYHKLMRRQMGIPPPRY